MVNKKSALKILSLVLLVLTACSSGKDVSSGDLSSSSAPESVIGSPSNNNSEPSESSQIPEEPSESSQIPEEPSEDEEAKPSFNISTKITQVANKPVLKLLYSSDKRLTQLDVKAYYKDELIKSETYDVDKYDELTGVTLDVCFGNVKVEVIGRTDDEFSNTVSSDVKVFAKEYNIAPLIATVPVTIYTFGMKGYTNDYKIPTLFYFERGTSWDYSSLPENTYPIPMFSVDELKDGELNNYESKVFDYIKELNTINKTSVFSTCDSEFLNWL